jgi:hypothetical protein
MRCRHAHEVIRAFPRIGEPPAILTDYGCKLKQASGAGKALMDGAAHARGIGVPVARDGCPLGRSGRWEECPCFEE